MTEPTKPRRRLSWQAVGRFFVHLLESFLWFDFAVLKAVGRFIGRRWRHVVLAGLSVLGVVGALLLYKQPAPHGFSAVILVDHELHVSSVSLRLPLIRRMPEDAPHSDVTMEAPQLRLVVFDSLAILGSDVQVLRAGLRVGTLDDSVPTRFDVQPVYMPQVGGGVWTLGADAAQLGVDIRHGFWRPTVRLTCERPRTARQLVPIWPGTNFSVEYIWLNLENSDCPAWDLPLARDVEVVKLQAESTPAGGPVRVEHDRQSVRFWGGWYLAADSVVAGSWVEFDPALRGSDSMSFEANGTTDTLSVDAGLCSLTVYSPQFKEPVVLGTRARVRFSGKIQMTGRVSCSDTRIKLNGLASSITYQFLSTMQDTSGAFRDSLVGQALQVLPSKLERLRDQTVALAAAVFAFLTLLGFIWDHFLKKD